MIHHIIFIIADCTGDAAKDVFEKRLYFLRKLRSFNVCIKMLHLFNKSAVRVQFTAAAASEPETQRNKLMKKAGSVLGTALEHMDLIVNRRMLHKLKNIKNNTNHHLHNIMLKQLV